MNEQPNDTVPVNNIHQFAALITGWHHNRTMQLELAINTPDDVDIEMGEGDEAHILLGPEREAFIEGLRVAKALLGTLPFTVTEVEEPACATAGDEVSGD